MDAAAGLSGAVFVGEFHDYITADKRPQFDSFLSEAPACVALVDFDQSVEFALKTAERLKQIFPNKVSIIALASQMDANLVLQAMRAGCSEYLTKPVALAVLSTTLSRFQNSAEVTMSTPAKSRGKVVTLSGAKGGVGATILAVHLALHLAHIRKKVLLIDHHADLGHVGLYLSLKEPQYYFEDVLKNAERLDADMLKGFVLRHKSGVDVIASPEKSYGSPKGPGEVAERVMTVLWREYDWVVVDTCFGLGEGRLPLLDHADQVFLVSTSEIGSLRDLSRRVERMRLSDAERKKIGIVLNRVTKTDPVTTDQISSTLNLPIAATIPDLDKELLQAINKGEPLDPGGKSALTKPMGTWVRSMTDADAAPAKGRVKHLAFWRK